MLKNLVLHFNLINKHRFKVFKLCIKAGIPFRGLIHDLSKYSPTEFFESIKYYKGSYSPISACKKENGYSKAWLHHKGRNKHHHEYWYDYSAPNTTALMPYKYTVEMICDTLAAGMTYQGKNWTNDYQLNYYLKDREKKHINPIIDDILLEVYKLISQKGINEVINSKTLKRIYYKHIDKKVIK
ncbi:MAG: catalase [Bacilli bacterium]|nr:catalase [Bacilli bacterium]